MSIKICGIGDIVIDHIFYKNEKETTYLGCRPGGSVGNSLINAKNVSSNTPVILYAVAGNDHFAKASSIYYCNAGIKTFLHIPPFPSRTEQFFQIIETKGDTNPSISFSRECPICKKQIKKDSYASFEASEYQPEIPSSSILCLDKIGKKRNLIAKNSKQKGNPTFLDLGRHKHLEELDITVIKEALIEHSFIQTTKATIDFLGNHLLFHNEKIENYKKRLTLVTYGKLGVKLQNSLFSSDNGDLFFSPPSIDQVIDDTGAGDTLMGNIVAQVALDFSNKKNSMPIRFSADSIASKIEDANLKVAKCLKKIGATGHIINHFIAGINEDSGLIGRTIDELQKQNPERCYICGS